MMDCANGKKHWDGGIGWTQPPVTEDKDALTCIDGADRFLTQSFQRSLKPRRAFGHRKQSRQNG